MPLDHPPRRLKVLGDVALAVRRPVPAAPAPPSPGTSNATPDSDPCRARQPPRAQAESPFPSAGLGMGRGGSPPLTGITDHQVGRSARLRHVLSRPTAAGRCPSSFTTAVTSTAELPSVKVLAKRRLRQRGAVDPRADLFCLISPEGRVPQDHPLRRIRVLGAAALAILSPLLPLPPAPPSPGTSNTTAAAEFAPDPFHRFPPPFSSIPQGYAAPSPAPNMARTLQSLPPRATVPSSYASPVPLGCCPAAGFGSRSGRSPVSSASIG